MNRGLVAKRSAAVGAVVARYWAELEGVEPADWSVLWNDFRSRVSGDDREVHLCLVWLRGVGEGVDHTRVRVALSKRSWTWLPGGAHPSPDVPGTAKPAIRT